MKNSKKMRSALLMTLIAVLAVSLSGCTVFDNFNNTFLEKKSGQDQKVLYIGVYEPSSGEFEKDGKDEIKGIELANAIYSNVRGMNVKLIKVDNQSDVNTSKTAIQNLIASKPVAIIGSAGEASSMIASAYVQDAKIPTITPSASNPLITQDNPYYFRACTTDSQKGAGLAEYAYTELGSRRIGIITTENDSSITAALSGFTKELNSSAQAEADQANAEAQAAAEADEDSEEAPVQVAATSPIVFKDTIAVDDNNMKKLMREIKKADVNVVYMPLGVEKADKLFSHIEDEGLADKITFLGMTSWNSTDFTKMMAKHPKIKVAFPSDTVIGTGYSTRNMVTAETQRFLVRYSQRYGDSDIPSEHAALGYDSYLLIMNALNNAKSLKTEDVREALQSLNNVRCATGVFTFDAEGTPVRPVNISTIEDGEIVSTYVTNNASQAQSMKKIDEAEAEKE